MSRAAALAALALLAACGGQGDGPGSASSPPGAPGYSVLRASGARIVNEAGETVRLRGVNLGGWLVKEGYILHLPGEALDAPSEIDRALVDLAGPVEGPKLLEEWRAQWITEADLAEIRSLGFDSVRLPLHHDLLWDLARGEPRAGRLRVPRRGRRLVREAAAVAVPRPALRARRPERREHLRQRRRRAPLHATSRTRTRPSPCGRRSPPATATAAR